MKNEPTEETYDAYLEEQMAHEAGQDVSEPVPADEG
jgi:hypothetical protein